MNLSRPLQLLVVLAATALLAPAASAASRCADDPERCVERGASVSRPSTRVVTAAPTATIQPATAPTARKLASVRKPVAKPARVAPRSTPPTPGMGMLLKLSSGSGGDVSWLPGRNVDNTGASWIL